MVNHLAAAAAGRTSLPSELVTVWRLVAQERDQGPKLRQSSQPSRPDPEKPAPDDGTEEFDL